MPTTVKVTDDHYDEFLKMINGAFRQNTGPIFTTDASPVKLWEAYLSNIPEDKRQVYNCNHCRHFIQRYGGLAQVTDAGALFPVVWGSHCPEFFYPATEAMRKLVLKSKITGVFLTNSRVLGAPLTGEWHHMAFHTHRDMKCFTESLTKSPFQLMAEKNEEFSMLITAVQTYPSDVVKQAEMIIRTDMVSRADKFKAQIAWFKECQEIFMATSRNNASINLLWKRIALAPEGWAHISSSVIGGLMQDLADMKGTREAIALFNAKVSPTTYQRATVAPSQGTIDQAEKIVAQLKAEGALSRRYATFDDLREVIWMKQSFAPKPPARAGGVFSSITPKGHVTNDNPVNLGSARKMTYVRFKETVLSHIDPRATIAIKTPATSERFGALVTGTNSEAPNILRWNNPVSWYIGDGVTSEMRKRVKGAGGNMDNVDFGFTLIWNDRNDLDIHCEGPTGHIYYGNKRFGNGWLDVDMNVGHDTDSPVENIRYNKMMRPAVTPAGRYKVYVHLYSFADHRQYESPFTVRIQLGNRVFMYTGRVSAYNRNAQVITFDYSPASLQQPFTYMTEATEVGIVSDDWNVLPNTWYPVEAIVKSPNQWDGQKGSPNLTFFLIKDCHDKKRVGQGFYPEMLKSDFHKVRSVMEAYAASQPIEGTPECCGLGLDSSQEWNLEISVTESNMTVTYLIDRYE